MTLLNAMESVVRLSVELMPREEFTQRRECKLCRRIQRRYHLSLVRRSRRSSWLYQCPTFTNCTVGQKGSSSTGLDKRDKT
ncbi:uncharacterized [Tachysurus ichikawai]